MKIEKFNLQTCCGGKSLSYKVDKPNSLDLLNKFKELGYHESVHLTKAGILYVDNMDLIVTGPLGANTLQVKCKKKDCDEKIRNFEDLLATL